MIMKIAGVLVDLLLEMAPEVYGKYVLYENGSKVLYVEVLQDLYGILVASILWYNKLRSNIEDIGLNPIPTTPMFPTECWTRGNTL